MFIKTVTDVNYSDPIFNQFDIKCSRKTRKESVVLLMDNFQVQVTECKSETKNGSRLLQYITLFGKKYLIGYYIENEEIECKKINEAIYTLFLDKGYNFVSGKMNNSDITVYLTNKKTGARISCYPTKHKKFVRYEMYSTDKANIDEDEILRYPLIVEVYDKVKKVYTNMHHRLRHGESAIVRYTTYSHTMSYMKDEYYLHSIDCKKRIYCAGNREIAKTKLLLMYNMFFGVENDEMILPLLKYL